MDLALRHGVRSLLQKSGKARVGLDFRRGLGVQVGGAPAALVEALKLALLTGQVLRKLVAGSQFRLVGVRLHAHELAAVEGAEMVFLTVDFEGRKIRDAHVVAEDALNGLIVPDTGNDNCAVLLETGALGSRQMPVRGNELIQTLRGDQAFVGVEVIVDGQELTGLVDRPFGHAAGCEEPGCDVPCRGFSLEGEILLSLLAVGQELLKAVDIRFRDDALVIVHKIAVVRGQRIGIQGTVGGLRGLDDAFRVLGGDFLSRLDAELGKGVRKDETSELVLCEAVQVAAGLNVGDHVRGSRAFRNSFDRRIELQAVFIAVVVIFDLLDSQIFDLFSNPDSDVVGLDFRRLRSIRLLAGFSGGLAAVIGSRRALTAFAGSKRKHHERSKKQCK